MAAMHDLEKRLAILLLAASLAAAAGDWPQWRGPERRGISNETGWHAPWPTAGPPQLWEAQLGDGYTAVSIADGRLFALGNRRQQGRDADTVYCLDAETGEERWRFSYACRRGSFKGPRVAPTIDGDRVYSLSREGDLFCFLAADGKVLWRRQLAREYRLKRQRHGMSCHPLVVGRLLIIEIGAPNAAVVALDKTDGQEVWRAGNEKLGYSSPVVYQRGGRSELAVLTGTALLGLDAEKGKQLWRYPWAPAYQCAIATPIVADNRIFISSGYKTGSAMLQLGEGEPREVWKNRVLLTQYNTPVLIDGRLYGFHGNESSKPAGQFLKCVDLADGREIWRQGGFGKAALMAADGKLIILSEDGQLVVAEASAAGYREFNRAQVVEKRCWTMPVLADGKVYCRNEKGHLVCIGVAQRYLDAKAAAATPAPPPAMPAPPIPAPELDGAWPGTAEGLRFFWAGLDGAAADRQLEVRGDCRLGKNGMAMRGGRILASNYSNPLLATCRQTNQLTIEAVLQTNDLKQIGPARIISFSTDPYKRNFTLGQQKQDLVLRLRTTKTGENGMKPEVKLGRLVAGKMHHVLVTYRPGKLAAYLDGKPLAVKQISGDFSNWTEQQLLFGNEWRGERKWFGRIRQTAIFSRFVEPEEALAHFKLSQGTPATPPREPPTPPPRPRCRPPRWRLQRPSWRSSIRPGGSPAVDSGCGRRSLRPRPCRRVSQSRSGWTCRPS